MSGQISSTYPVTGSDLGALISRPEIEAVSASYRPARAGGRRTHALAFLLFLLFSLVEGAGAQSVQYSRPVESAPQEDSIGGQYKTPSVQKPRPRDYWLQVADFALLAAAMGAAVWIVVKRRSRRWLVALSLGSLAYFGFYREGCICPIGSIQNVTVALVDPKYSIPILVTGTFFLPLIVALFYGRAFCGGACALGAIQEAVVLKPVKVPKWLDRPLGYLKYVYLGLSIFVAVKPAAARDFLICRFDPFVGLFRFSGTWYMLVAGGAILAIGMFVGRPYCRYLCPYGGLLSWVTMLAKRGVTTTPGKELDCGLCSDACPFGAIENMRVVRRKCFYCARCYASCPCDGDLAHAKAQMIQVSGSK
jgi:hypothetical protein